MSFRLRVLLLTVFLVATSSAATAWLTLQQAQRQLTDSVAASQRDVTVAVDTLAGYGRTHGSWSGVEQPVADLAGRLGQRIRVVADSGAVLADSDLLGGRPARAVAGPPSLVDIRPTLKFPAGGQLDNAYERFLWTLAVADGYARGWILASCLAKAGVGGRIVELGTKPPFFEPVGGTEAVRAACNHEARQAKFADGPVTRLGKSCLKRPDDRVCLSELLAEELALYAPTVQLYIGARDEVPQRLSSKSIALAATAVVLATAVCAVLLSRRVLRPIGALTTASRRLGSGGRADPVPVSGRDELAELGRAFNRMARSLADSEERQRRLVADVAHELRTPLANLRGYLEALADGVLPPSPELFASLHEEALLQQRIVDDLQDLAMAEAGVLAYHRMVVDLAELAEVSRTAHAAVADAAGLALDVRVEAAAERSREASGVRSVLVHADPDRLRQVLGNLIRNAITATAPGGQITLTVSADGPYARITVADTGRGIAEADLPHVFDRLWRADPARGRSGGGLGLAIARQIVTDHGGTIQVASRLGAGTTFLIILPALRQ